MCNEIEGEITWYDDRYIKLTQLVIMLINKLVYDDIHPTRIRNLYQEISYIKHIFEISKGFTGEIMKRF